MKSSINPNSPCRELAWTFVNSVPTLKGNICAADKLTTIFEDTAEKFLAAYEEALVLEKHEPDKPPNQILRIGGSWSWSCTTTVKDPVNIDDDC